jgi:hypothetical protein
MEFFNKKEEVLDLQLTQYGKYLLSLGKLKPVYYAFYDDGIVYDSEYAGFAENQNNASSRIQEDSPNLKAFHNFHSIEDDISKAVKEQNSGNEDLAQLMLQQTPEKSQILINPLSNSDLATDKIPSWNISLLSGEILTGSTTSTLTLSGSGTVLDIPQIEVEVEYTVNVEMGEPFSQQEIDEIARGDVDGVPQGVLEDSLNTGEVINSQSDERIFEDGSFFTISMDDLIFQIIEENVPQGNDNFEVELFEIEETSNTTEIKQLRLFVDSDNIVNDILLDEEEGNNLPVSEVDSSFADYYFEIETDDEIDASIICRLIKDGDKDDYKFARKDFECPDSEPNYQFLNPYSQKSDSDVCKD